MLCQEEIKPAQWDKVPVPEEEKVFVVEINNRAIPTRIIAVGPAGDLVRGIMLVARVMG